MNRKHRHRADRSASADRPPHPPHRDKRQASPSRQPAAADRHTPKRAEAAPEIHHRSEPRQRSEPGGGTPWIYGAHAALAAIANPTRKIQRILLGQEQAGELGPQVEAARSARGDLAPAALPATREELERTLPRGAVHQGLAVQTADLEPLDLEDVLRAVGDSPRGRLVLLDQVTDPHNVGAILRSAAAFGVSAVIVPERHAPGASAVMAKAASGALERVPLARVVNLARALDQLKAANFWCIGLDGDAPQSIAEADLTGRIALVFGSEGEGLRRLTRERCDLLVRIPMARGGIESLNVSNAAAVALYELARRG